MRLCLIFSVTILSLYVSASNIIINNSTNYLDGNTTLISPGDTLFIQGGTRNGLDIRNINGSITNPIVIINKDSVCNIISSSNFGLKIVNSKHVKLIGNGTSNQYGFKITSTDIGIQYTGGWSNTSGSSDIEIQQVEIYNCYTGILGKSINDRSSFIQKNSIIANSYFHHIDREAIYLGSSFYHNSNDHLLSGVWVYNNIVDSTGWDGIQIGSATDSCWVFNNHIMNDSYLKTGSQMSGIMLNPGSKCDCYNNFIKNGKGPGIFDQGLGENNIYNNVIINAGVDGDSTAPRGGDGIAIWGVNRPYSTGNSIYVFHNTIVSPMNNGITFAYDPSTQGNQSIISNNIIINPKGKAYHGTTSNNSFIEAYLNASYTNTGNYTNHILSNPKFVNSSMDSFYLQPSSPVINTGSNLFLTEQQYDKDSTIRNLTYITPGAYHSKINTTNIISNRYNYNFYFDKHSKILTVFNLKESDLINVYNLTGQKIHFNKINQTNIRLAHENQRIIIVNINGTAFKVPVWEY